MLVSRVRFNLMSLRLYSDTGGENKRKEKIEIGREEGRENIKNNWPKEEKLNFINVACLNLWKRSPTCPPV